jgi:hypothetical protein
LQTFNLTPYRGRTVRLEFVAEENNGSMTSFVLDDQDHRGVTAARGLGVKLTLKLAYTAVLARHRSRPNIKRHNSHRLYGARLATARAVPHPFAAQIGFKRARVPESSEPFAFHLTS